MKMAKTIFAKDPVKFIPALAEALKKIPEFEVPEWAQFVKSGVAKARPPVDVDFWYTRTASILRQMYIKGVVGVGKLRTRYGSKMNRGGRPDKFRKASGKIIRVILQQAEAAGLVEKVLRMQHGRRLTQAGRDLLDSIEGSSEDIDSSGWTVATPTGQVASVEDDFSGEEINEGVEEEVVEAVEEKIEEGARASVPSKEGKDGE